MTIQATPARLLALAAGEFDLVLRWGCIRLGVNNEYGQPYWHVNSVHSRGGTSGYGGLDIKVERSNGSLVIHGLDSVLGEEVVGLYPIPDETLAQLGVIPGASGVPGSFLISLWKDGIKVSCNDLLFNSNTANIWLLYIAAQPSVGFNSYLEDTPVITNILQRLSALEGV